MQKKERCFAHVCALLNISERGEISLVFDIFLFYVPFLIPLKIEKFPLYGSTTIVKAVNYFFAPIFMALFFTGNLIIRDFYTREERSTKVRNSEKILFAQKL